MNIDLDKEDLTSLVRGASPHYDILPELFELYTLCKNSWKK